MENKLEFTNTEIEKEHNSADFVQDIDIFLFKYFKNIDPNLIPPYAVETKKEGVGDISFNALEYSKRIDLNTVAVEVRNRFSQYINRTEVLNGYINIFLNQEKVACELANEFNVEKNLALMVGKKFDVEFGHLNLEKSQNIGHLRNLFTGTGHANLLKVAGGTVSTSVIVNDVGIKASRLYNSILKNKATFDNIY